MKIIYKFRKSIPAAFENNLLFLIIFNMVVNSLLTFFDRGGGLALLRASVIYLTIALMMIFRNCFKEHSINIIYVVILYFLLRVLSSSDFSRSVSIFLKVSGSLLLFPVAMTYITKNSDLLKILSFIKISLFYFVCFSILASVFGIGWNQYATDNQSTSVSTGFGGSQLYLFSLAFVAFPFYKEHFTGKISIWMYLLLIVCFLLLLFSLRRTSVAIVLAGVFLYFFYSGKLLKFWRFIIIGAIVMVALFPLYKDILMDRLALRENITTDNYSVEDELRWVETVYLWNDIRNYNEFSTVIFGKEIFNSPHNYAGGALGDRMLHVDYNRILHGGGFLGISLYLLMYVFILRTFYYYYNRSSLKNKSELKGLFLSYYLLSLFISFSGQMDNLSFRSVLFIIMGATVGVLRKNATINYTIFDYLRKEKQKNGIPESTITPSLT